MNRSSLPAVLFFFALFASKTPLVVSEYSKIVEEAVSVVSNNVTGDAGNNTLPKEDTLADMIDRALEKEFPDNDDQNEVNDAGGFNNSVTEQQAVLETVARVKSKKNETKEEKPFKLHHVFNLDNDNGAEETPTLIDRKDNVFIISNFKSKYPVLQLDLRLISDMVVVIVSATCGGIAFACAGQPVITGYLLAGSVVGPGGFNVISEMVQVETVAQFGVIFLLFALGLEFSATKLRIVRAVAVLGGLLQILLFMCLCGIIASLSGGGASEGVFIGAFLSMSSTAVVYKFLMEKNSINSLHGQVTIGTLILQDCAVGLLFALLPVLGGTSGLLQGVISMTKSLVVLIAFLAVLAILSRTCVPWFLKLMISLSSQTNELYQLAAVAFCLLVTWCSDKLGLSLELGSFAAGVMISTTDLSQHTLEQVEPIRNIFAALFLASIGMLIHVQFLWNHVDILFASVILVVIIKTVVISAVVKGFGYNNKTSILVGMSLAQIGEFAFVLLSRASNLHLVEGKVYLLLLGTTALSLVTTPLLFKLIPAVVHLGVLLRWFSPDIQSEENGTEISCALPRTPRHALKSGPANDLEAPNIRKLQLLLWFGGGLRDPFNMQNDGSESHSVVTDVNSLNSALATLGYSDSVYRLNHNHAISGFPQPLSFVEAVNNLVCGQMVNRDGIWNSNIQDPNQVMEGVPFPTVNPATTLSYARNGTLDHQEKLPNFGHCAYPFDGSSNVVYSSFETMNHGYESLPFDSSTKWELNKFVIPESFGRVIGRNGVQPLNPTEYSFPNEWILSQNTAATNSNSRGSSRFSNELSLSLASSPPSTVHGTSIRHQCAEQTSCSSTSLSLSFDSYKPLQPSPLLGSRLFQAMQEILAEIACYALVSCSTAGVDNGNNVQVLNSRGIFPSDKWEVEAKKKHMLALLQMIDEQYNRCLDEVHTVVSAFHAVTELDSRLHARFALPAISSMYKNLRERISSHILAMGTNLNEGEDQEKEEKSFETSFIQKQWALQQIRKSDSQLWRPQRGLPERSVSVLRAWMFQNFLHPYPKDAEKHLLAIKSGLTRNQVSNWFINARVRLWKPMIEEMYAEMSRRKACRNGEDQTDHGNFHRNQMHFDSRSRRFAMD